MLVLTRSANQSIVIGHDIVLTVLEVRGDQVRIGIDAPREIQVHRMEVFQALQEANRQAAESAGDLDALQQLAAKAPADRRPPPA
ncbi:carbon storage regulator CsrA [Acidiferrimicrobium sp. IK]|uniref:carbon storage regulator CsrA n=1 Tax=Acidiferrimicrobium sp. IK TaxID=2871700 RepID=UPI0021CAF4DD|nr:carbon storage regulator CsrA [Acidiferrimicrobium sp. IK]MCU4185047.1 carbon storage regulator CsrA [Acidiferrimicrobium sp. IK]